MKTASLITSAAILGLSISGVGLAMAQDGPRNPGSHSRGGPGMFGPHHPPLAQLDMDNDGNITKAELEAHEATMFAEMDQDQSGDVTAEELAAHHEAKREQMRRQREARMEQAMLDRLDTDGDGVISRAEFTDRPNPMFDRLDEDGDGVITEAERAAMKEKFADRRKGEMHERWRERRGQWKDNRSE